MDSLISLPSVGYPFLSFAAIAMSLTSIIDQAISRVGLTQMASGALCRCLDVLQDHHIWFLASSTPIRKSEGAASYIDRVAKAFDAQLGMKNGLLDRQTEPFSWRVDSAFYT